MRDAVRRFRLYHHADNRRNTPAASACKVDIKIQTGLSHGDPGEDVMCPGQICREDDPNILCFGVAMVPYPTCCVCQRLHRT
jgi:hypothetical protein